MDYNGTADYQFPYRVRKNPSIRNVYLVVVLLFSALTLPLFLSGDANLAPLGLLIIALVAGPLGVSMALASWQSVLLMDDSLLFSAWGRKHKVFYTNIRYGDVIETVGYKSSPSLSLWIYHEPAEGAKSPLKVNLALFAPSERIVLLNTIARFAPGVELNDAAKKMQAGVRVGI